MIRTRNPLSTLFDKLVNSDRQPILTCITCLSPTEGVAVCADCRRELPWNGPDQCRCCALPGRFGESALCGECQASPPPFDHVIAPWRYEFPVNTLISRFKYRGIRVEGRALAELLSHHLIGRSDDRPEALVPVPMFARKERQRTFNQAEEIAHRVGRELDIPVLNHHLVRVRGTIAQSHLDRKQRLSNLRRAFRLRRPIPDHVALIDDVMTTGATVRAVCETLRREGSTRVDVWVLARTDFQRS